MVKLSGFRARCRVVLAACICVVGEAADVASGYRFEMLRFLDPTNAGSANADLGMNALRGVYSGGRLYSLVHKW